MRHKFEMAVIAKEEIALANKKNLVATHIIRHTYTKHLITKENDYRPQKDDHSLWIILTVVERCLQAFITNASQK